MKLNGNTVMITGGATGIGFALAEEFLAQGSKVIICGRREQKLLEAQKKHSDLSIKVCDVADEFSRKELYEWTKANFPAVNVLINNAGIQRYIDFTKGTEELCSGENEIRTNLEGPIFLSALFVPLLAGKDEAAIVNVTAGSGFFPAANQPIYSATKAALHMFSVIIRQQLAPMGIKVFEAIAPGILDTELNLAGRVKFRKENPHFETPSSADYAAAVLIGMEKDDYEIGYEYTNDWKNLSKAELDKMFTDQFAKGR
ncbi:MAG: SDR family NAD(P)-dependent oxidoreductase [Firmicutes bacterium]|nr:SDR family NAD(P)-dependent oxidoreductase [Bacillota bacterium]